MPIGALIEGGVALLGQRQQSKHAKRQHALQQRAYTHGIRDRVKDARAAGIHPLAAIGASTHSPAPVALSTAGLESAGQSFGRAAQAISGRGNRESGYVKEVQKLQLTRLSLENDLLASRIATMHQGGQTPIGPTDPSGVPGDTNTNAGVHHRLPGSVVAERPMARERASPGRGHREGGIVTSIGYGRTKTGLAPVYSRDIKERLEDDFLGMLAWNLRNRILPSLGYNKTPPGPAPHGQRWVYDPLYQEYRLKKGRYQHAPKKRIRKKKNQAHGPLYP